MWKLFASTVILIASSSLAQNRQPSHPVPQSKTNAFVGDLDELVASLRQDFGEFGMGIAVVENGRIVAERYYGFADVGRRVRMSEDSLVNTASVSKAVTALGVMQLADARQIDLDAPVFPRIRRWQLPTSEFSAEGVTAARLLSHTSGMSRHTTGTWTVNDKLPTLEAALSGDNKGYGDTRLVTAPGTKWSYSGGGYSVLQLLVEEVTEKPFTDYMNERVLPAVGIRSSRFGWSPEVVRRSVTYYDEFGKAVDAYRTIELAAGGFNSTAKDLARFATVFSKVRPPARRQALSPAMMRRMIAPVPAGEMTPNIQFGLGVMLQRLADGRTIIAHDGGNPGSGAYFAIHPDSGNGIAIVVNRSWAAQAFLPIACAWRNATAPAGATAETCNRDLTGILVNTIASRGIGAAKARYDQLIAEAPNRLAEPNMLRMARQLGYAERYSDAEAVLRWHLARNPRSAPTFDRLGDILTAAGNREGAREAWSESLRIDPGQADVRLKLEQLKQ